MLRWCGPNPLTIEPVTRKTRSGTHYDDSAKDAYEEETKLMLQAEYLVRVTNSSYISSRADPSLLGNFFFDSANYDPDDDIAMGPRQDELIHPLEQFMIGAEESLAVTSYAEQHLSTIDQLVEAIPKIRQEFRTSFSADVCPGLSSEQQHVFLSILAFAKREGSIFNILPDRGMLFDIFSFLPIQDVGQRAELRRIYLSLECPSYLYQRRYLFRALDDVSMKRCATCLVLEKISTLAERLEDDVLSLPSGGDDGDDNALLLQKQQRALALGQKLRDTLDELDRLDLPMHELFPRHNPTEWMRKRLQHFDNRSSMDEFLDHLANVAPQNL